MYDITACVNSTCNKRFGCLRYKGVWPNPKTQSYSRFEAGDCLYYRQIDPSDRVVSDQEADRRLLK